MRIYLIIIILLLSSLICIGQVDTNRVSDRLTTDAIHDGDTLTGQWVKDSTVIDIIYKHKVVKVYTQGYVFNFEILSIKEDISTMTTRIMLVTEDRKIVHMTGLYYPGKGLFIIIKKGGSEILVHVANRQDLE